MTTDSLPHVAVIGAGMAGLTCARELADAGACVTVFDKSRGPSGRLSTRRREGGQWDHGAPYFEAQQADFVQQCGLWQAEGVLAPFGPSGAFIGVPRMSALGRHLARDISLVTSCRVEQVERVAGGWKLTDEDGVDRGTFALVVVAVPAPQAVPLLAALPSFQEQARSTEMMPAHALLLALAEPLHGLPALIRPKDGPFETIVRNTQKPGRPEAECWVGHTRAEWTHTMLERDPASLADELVAAFADAVGQPVRPDSVQVHRWRYSQSTHTAAWDAGYAWDAASGLGVCGDWCAGGGVEAAWTSGKRLGQTILESDRLR